jgi:hypothetical protein
MLEFLPIRLMMLKPSCPSVTWNGGRYNFRGPRAKDSELKGLRMSLKVCILNNLIR